MANFNYNKVVLGGRLCSAPELKQTKSGIYVANCRIAVNRRYAEKQADGSSEYATDFINIIAWRQNAEFLTKWFDKSSSICVTGSLQTRKYTDKQGEKKYITEVVAEEINFVDSKDNALRTAAPQYQVPEMASYGATAPQFEVLSENDELSF